MRMVLVGLVVLVGTSHADPAPPSLDDAVKQAAAANKPLVIEFSASWCGPCKVFEKDVLGDPLVQTSLQHVVFVHYDAEVSPGLEAASRYDIEGFPTFVVIDRRGGIGAKNVGFLDRNHFIDFVEDAENHLLDETSVRLKLRAHGKDPAVRLSAARWFETHHLVLDAVANYEAVAKNPAATTAVRAEARKAGEHLRRIDAWRHDLIADKVAAITADPATVPFDDIATATVGSGLDAKEIDTLFTAIFRAQTDVGRSNELVYVALAAGAPNPALAAAKANVATRRSAQFLDTLAECFHVTGDRSQALALEDEAIQNNNQMTQLTRNRARFDSAIGEADEVIALRGRTTQLWKQLEIVDDLSAIRAPRTVAMNQQMVAMRQTYQEERKLADSVAQACAKEAGKSEVAYVRFDLDPTNAPKAIVVLVDDLATPKLRACITTSLGKVTLQPRPFGPQQRELRLTFRTP